MKLLLLFLIIASPMSSYAFNADYFYGEIYPGVEPKIEFIINKYCNKKDPIHIEEHFSEKEFREEETGKPVLKRVVHIYAKHFPCNKKKYLTEMVKKQIKLPVDEKKITQINVTVVNFGDFNTIGRIVETKEDLRKTLPQVAGEKRFSTEISLLESYYEEKISDKNKNEIKELANSILKQSKNFKKHWNYGNSVFDPNIFLGRISLFEGNIEEAKRYLLLAGKTPGGPALSSFGPNMTLAKELLEKGEKEVVLQFFDLCTKFWEGEFATPKIEKWRKEISENKIPDFGAHLVY